MYESYKAKEILDIPSLPTLSDGSAGGVDPDAVSIFRLYAIIESAKNHFSWYNSNLICMYILN